MKRSLDFSNKLAARKATVITTVKEIKECLKNKTKTGQIGLVPTMGALHSGHKSLIEKSVCENETTVVSIFVNPTQFGVNEDFDKYPRTLAGDVKICEEMGVDYIFAPNADEMYSNLKDTTLICPSYDDVNKLCGKSRIGHFDGVATVVGKLFNIIKPDNAYFGKKDAQQLFIIQKMVKDLNFDVNIVPCPIIREPDGMALSSRNIYLDADGRKAALNISRALFKVQELFKAGVCDFKSLSDAVLAILCNENAVSSACQTEDLLASSPLTTSIANVCEHCSSKIPSHTPPAIEIEYFEIVDANNFEIYENIDIITNERKRKNEDISFLNEQNKTRSVIKPHSIALIAVKINGVRLIDNVDLIK